ncbi:hypothetical protein HPB50_005361 [Hyalomma asiaticum]|uniref:Uncharacterized protein n=1 Tax=Hyalomma asiaticum TaxID=266040 RepID=A0ACB7TEZ0_HYAAI|nr:hypothetical protein HPB50_005361 [Hyalomma asiaticum]
MANAAAPATFTFQQPKEPPKFRESGCEDSQEWLHRFERVASYKWSEEDKLQNAFFSLEESNAHGSKTKKAL